MSANDAWARARLTRGTSSGEIWEINAEYPEARLTLGSDPSAGWRIDAAGVKPIACELFWDGQALWVADTHQGGGVFLDGQRITEWKQVQGPAEIRFGQASIDIETSAPAHQRMASSPSLARPVTVTDAAVPAPTTDRGSIPVFGGAAGDESVPDLEAAKTRVASSPLSRVPGGLDDGARTEMVHTPESRGPDLRPRLGGGPPAPKAHAQEATRMVSIPVSPHAPAVTAPHAAQPMAPMAPPMPPQMMPMLGSPAPVVAPPPAAPMSSSAPPPPAPPMHAPPVPMMPAGPVAFAPPPEPVTTQEPKAGVLEKIKGVLAHEQPQTDGKQAMPTRTWILLGITVAFTVGWLLWPEPEPEPAAPASNAVVVAGGTTATPATDPATDPATSVATPTPTPTPPEPPPPVVADPSPPATAESEGDPTDGPTLQRRAADAYLGGRYAEALPLYQQLLAAAPQDAAYQAMVSILERRVADGCRDSNGGQPCEQ